MKFKFLYKTQTVNILVAVLIAVFVVFPIIIRSFDDQRPSDILNNEEHFDKEFQKHDQLPPFPEKNRWRDAPPPEIKIKPDKRFVKFDLFKSAVFEFLFFAFLSWCLLYINNPVKKLRINLIGEKTNQIFILGLSLIVCYVLILLYGFFNHFRPFRTNPFYWFLDGILLFKGIFVFVSVILFSQIFKLLDRQQQMKLENEMLKTESLQNRIEALTAQISPHFFFNSLNSLSGLIRDKKEKKALNYINEISNIFRYVLQGKGQDLVRLKEELLFLDAYRYLLEIRYEDKILFNVEINEEQSNNLKLLSLSVQPLIENITKHNIISREKPMRVKIHIKNDDLLIIENTFQPKTNNDLNTGIGINNLSKRYKYVTGKNINYYIQNNIFVVELPLI